MKQKGPQSSCIDLEELQSKTITFLRFPLIVGVVLIHSTLSDVSFAGINYGEGYYPLYEYSAKFLSSILSAISVPLFYFISGFLFFYKTEKFTLQIYERKIAKRAGTILVPYIIWNLIVIVLSFLGQVFLPGLLSGRNELIVNYSLSDWLWAFWNTDHSFISGKEGAYPICYQFWFIRDLFVVMLCSPLLYAFINKLREYSIGFLGILWLCGWWFDIVGLNCSAFFFFSFGAYFSIHKKNFVQIMRQSFPLVFVIYVGMVIVELCCDSAIWIRYVHSLGIIAGIMSAVSLTSYFIEKGKWNTNEFLSSSSFWIYAYHAMPLAFMIKLLFKLVTPKTDIVILFIYLFAPLVTILVGLAIYWGLKAYFPRFTAIITGGR